MKKYITSEVVMRASVVAETNIYQSSNKLILTNTTLANSKSGKGSD